MIASIQTRNPHVIRVVVEEQKKHGAGRSAAEAIETLALEAIERRRSERSHKDSTGPNSRVLDELGSTRL